MHRFASLTTLALAAFCTAQETAWLTNFTEAKAKAKAEKKDLLVDFTGSDWCGWCIKLDEEVFSKDEFKKAAPNQFVLVKLDYPRNKDLVTDEIRAQNKELGEKYQIQGYPTILLLDCEGRVYGQTGYLDGGPEKYTTHLGDLKKKGDAFLAALALADTKKDLDRAKALDEALGLIDAEMASTHYLSTMQEILKLDADGKGGLKAKYETKVQDLADAKELDSMAGALQESIGPHMQAGEHDKAIAKLDEIVKAPKNKLHHQLALFFKGMVIMEGKEDAKAAIAELEAAKAINPESPIGKQITMILPRIQEMAKQKEGGKEEKKEGGK